MPSNGEGDGKGGGKGGGKGDGKANPSVSRGRVHLMAIAYRMRGQLGIFAPDVAS